MNRDERQTLCIQKWLNAKGHATIVAATGFGKSRVGLRIIQGLLSKKNDCQIIIVVPTITLKEQWTKSIDKWGFTFNCDIQVINTAINKDQVCDLLIIDECHTANADTFQHVFDKIKYRWILGLTATFERIDGKHEICNKYCPVCDTVPIEECLANGWVSSYKEYQVIIDVDDIDIYKGYNKEFTKSFEFFDFSWDRVNSCLGKDGFKYRYQLSKEMCPNDEEKRKNMMKNITYHATNFMRVLQTRKAFINNHPKKLEIARKIIEARPDSKIITFSNSIKMAEAIGIGPVYSGKDSKKKGRITLEEYINGNYQVLNTIRKADAGLDIPSISVAIIIGTDSSKIRAIQRLGRTCRFEEGKTAEIFNIIINDTVELSWFANSHKNSQFITIDEDGLDAVLRYEEPKPYFKRIKNFQFRY